MACATLMLRFFEAKVSDGMQSTATALAPPATESLKPRMLGTSTGYETPGRMVMPASTSLWSPICGTHLGDTKLVGSTTEAPTSLSRLMNSILTSVGTCVASFCSPSRGPSS